MFYQSIILSDRNGYECRTIMDSYFDSHWHFEIELLYCIDGSFKINTKDAEYIVEQGQYVIINSTEEHSYSQIREKTVTFYTEFGSGLLGSGFTEITKSIYSAIPNNEKIANCLKRLISEYEKSGPDCDWMIRAILYEMAALIMREVPCHRCSSVDENRIGRLNAILPALEYISSSYGKHITVEDAAEATHYEKTAFCRAFKNLIGMPFHKYLNIYRIEQASRLIETGIYGIGEAANLCGIEQPKTFSRLFRQYTGMKPTEYRDSLL